MKADVLPICRYRAIFISDVHLGTRRAQAAALLDFLRETESKRLYLLGDMIDSWSLRQNWYWDQLHNDVVQKILRKARKGTKVIFIPGNHDENFRDFFGHRFGHVAVVRWRRSAIQIRSSPVILAGICPSSFGKVLRWSALRTGTRGTGRLR